MYIYTSYPVHAILFFSASQVYPPIPGNTALIRINCFQCRLPIHASHASSSSIFAPRPAAGQVWRFRIPNSLSYHLLCHHSLLIAFGSVLRSSDTNQPPHPPEKTSIHLHHTTYISTAPIQLIRPINPNHLNPRGHLPDLYPSWPLHTPYQSVSLASAQKCTSTFPPPFLTSPPSTTPTRKAPPPASSSSLPFLPLYPPPNPSNKLHTSSSAHKTATGKTAAHTQAKSPLKNSNKLVAQLLN